MDRRSLIKTIESVLDERRLVWVGLRGDDAEPLADLRQFRAAFSLISAYDRRAGVQAESYESISGTRVDPETWDIDDHLHAEATIEFRERLLRSLSSETVVVPYRPSQFLSAVLFARAGRAKPLGIFGALQAALEHKPWVETAVAELGIPHVEWRYIADEEQLSAVPMLDEGPVILRRSRTSGGEGITRVDTVADLNPQWPHIDEAFASVAPFIDGGVPVNVGAVVWADGVTTHHVSVQVIGVPDLVTRPFGYCGNDFGAARDLPPHVVNEIETAAQRVGEWLRSHGFRGAFGIDFLVHDNHALFLEVNPRFQGSTHASAQLDAEADQSCLLLEHVAAWLDVPAPKSRPLREVVGDTPDLSHLVVHWTGEPGRVDVAPLVAKAYEIPATVRTELAPSTTMICETGAAILRWTLRQRATQTGYEVLANLEGVDARLVSSGTGKES